jgi:flagellar capping protein FliD
MKKVSVTFIIILLIACAAFAQTTRGSRGIVNVSDNRSVGVASYDSSVVSRNAGDVAVKRVNTRTQSNKTANGYDIYFYKPHEKKLYGYRSTVMSDSAFDKASYDWSNDSVVNVSLNNSRTKYKKEVRLRQPRTRGGNALAIASGK